MAYARSEVKDLAGKVKGKAKKFVRYKEGAELYSVGLHTFEAWAKEAKAIYHVGHIVLVNTDLIDEYLETYRDEF
jgi:hypothetical protein